MGARIIGVGQQWAGDDSAGLAVIRHLRQLECQSNLVEIEDPSRLIELLTDGADPVVIVDAVVNDGAGGRVLMIDARRHGSNSAHLLSTHGIDVMQAIELARIAHPDCVSQRIFVLGITIVQATRNGGNLSEAVRAAVARAAAQAIELCRTQAT